MKKNNYNIIALFGAIVFFAFGYFTHGVLIKNNTPKSIDQNKFSLFWNVWNDLEEKYPFKEPLESEKIYGAINGLVESYHDDYSTFFPPESAKLFQDTVTGTFGGAGMEVSISEGYLYVIAPLKNSPAEVAGVLAGDIIIKIDGKDISGKSMDDILDLIRGEIGTEVKVTIIRAENNKPIDITITRDIVKIPILDTKSIDNYFIVSLYNFNLDSQKAFKNALKKFKDSKLKHLVIDVRNNPGGFLTSAIDISSYFLEQGKIIVIEDFGDSGKSQKIHRSKGFDLLKDVDFDITVLSNKGSASASEILIGSLQDNKKGFIVGETSYGKGSVQELINLDQNTSLKITTAKWLTPNKHQISKKGIQPDFNIENINNINLSEIINILKKKDNKKE